MRDPMQVGHNIKPQVESLIAARTNHLPTTSVTKDQITRVRICAIADEAIAQYRKDSQVGLVTYWLRQGVINYVPMAEALDTLNLITSNLAPLKRAKVQATLDMLLWLLKPDSEAVILQVEKNKAVTLSVFLVRQLILVDPQRISSMYQGTHIIHEMKDPDLIPPNLLKDWPPDLQRTVAFAYEHQANTAYYTLAHPKLGNMGHVQVTHSDQGMSVSDQQRIVDTNATEAGRRDAAFQSILRVIAEEETRSPSGSEHPA